MNRALKLLFYGVLYLALVALVVFGIYRIWFYKVPTCSDNVQNGSETGIDCGGSCIPCAAKNLKLDVSIVPQIFPATGNQSVLFAKIVNPSSSYAVKSFSYSIKVWSVLGVPITTITGSSYIAPAGTRYIIFPNLASAAANVEQPLLPIVVSDAVWVPASNFTGYDLQISDIATNLTASGGEVDGTIVNNSPSSVPLTRLSALVFNIKGNVIGASAATVQDLAPFSVRQFRIYLPPLGRVANPVDRAKTQVVYEVVKN